MDKSKKIWLWLAAGVLILGGFWMLAQMVEAQVAQAKGTKTVGQRVKQYGAAARARLAPGFAKAGVAYPPSEVVLVGLKQEKRLEVWARLPEAPRPAAADSAKAAAPATPRYVKVAEYPVLAASGVLGPKLREGDSQVPEGLYGIALLNPNSRYHLSLRVDYPNAADRAQAQLDGRDMKTLGGDIMIHGANCSIGCLAMGDPASEDLFVLAADAGLPNLRVILAPVDFRVSELPPNFAEKQPSWVRKRYTEIRAELLKLK
jgi:hypothetical protein